MSSYGPVYILRTLIKPLKYCVRKRKVLRYYRPDLDLFLETDASGVAIGMELLQSDY